MKLEITQRVEKDIRWLEIDAGVRYWEDAYIDGTQDNEPEDGDGDPRMPFAQKDGEGQWRWRPRIDLDRGAVEGWPEGTTADVHYKVCDDGSYRLLDTENNTVVEGENVYVPGCIGLYGDYIVMDIGPDGLIDGFRFTQDDLDELAEEWGG